MRPLFHGLQRDPPPRWELVGGLHVDAAGRIRAGAAGDGTILEPAMPRMEAMR